MRASRGEMKIAEILELYGVNFVEEYSFPDLVSPTGNLLRFDFAIFDDAGDIDFLIEFQGIQHYKPKTKFGGESGLRKQKINDERKKDYCRKHGYCLICIPYWQEGEISYDYIMRAAGY